MVIQSSSHVFIYHMGFFIGSLPRSPAVAQPGPKVEDGPAISGEAQISQQQRQRSEAFLVTCRAARDGAEVGMAAAWLVKQWY